MGEIVSVQKTNITEQSSSRAKLKTERTTTELKKREKSENMRRRIDLSKDPLWKQILLQRPSYTIDNYKGDRSSKSMRIARFFISSTFKDFFYEREFLVKHVLPELEDICRNSVVTFYDCDLRWGIPRDFGDSKTISVCLDTIEQCKYETEGEPFFILFLGSRYGWVPDLSDQSKFSPDFKDYYDWVSGASITHMEVVKAALLRPNPNALIFIRNVEFPNSISKDLRNDYVDTSKHSEQKLESLKNSLFQTYSDSQIIEYTPSVIAEENSQALKIEDLSEIQSKVVNFFSSRVSQTFPMDNLDKNWEKLANVKSLAVNFVGREQELKQLNRFLTTNQNIFPMLDIDQSESSSNDFSANQNKESSFQSNIVLVTSESGAGKTALLAKLVENLSEKSDKYNLIYHFVSNNPASQAQSSFLEETIDSMHDFMNYTTENNENDKQDSASQETLIAKFETVVKKSSELSKPLMIIVDSVDLMEKSEQHQQTFLSWVSRVFHESPNTKLIISSSLENDAILLRLRNLDITVLRLQGLSRAQSQNFVQKFFSNYKKQLDETQYEVLLDKRNACFPLWLEMACRELVTFGVFETLTDKIRSFPDDIWELGKNILERILTEDDTKLISRASGYLLCVKTGLTECDMRMLMGDFAAKNQLNAKNWNMVLRQLRPYLLMYKRQSEVIYSLKEDCIRKAIEDLLSNEDCQQSRLDILKYFRDFKSSLCDERTIQIEVPFQLQKLGKNNELVSFFKTHEIGIKSPYFEKSQFLKRLACSKMCQKNQINETQLFVCVFCKNSMKGMGQLVRPNAQCCVICSGPTNFSPVGGGEAWLCVMHKVNTAPNCSTCFVCKRTILPNMEKTPLRKCMLCSSIPNQCSFLTSQRY